MALKRGFFVSFMAGIVIIGFLFRGDLGLSTDAGTITAPYVYSGVNKLSPLFSSPSWAAEKLVKALQSDGAAIKEPIALDPSTLAIPGCGDGICEAHPAIGPPETCYTCSTDCGACPLICGKWGCQVNETCSNCPHDCGLCGGGSMCPDGYCTGGETYITCPQDCVRNPVCGDEFCEQLETCANCMADCGPCSGSSSSLYCHFDGGKTLPYCR